MSTTYILIFMFLSTVSSIFPVLLPNF